MSRPAAALAAALVCAVSATGCTRAPAPAVTQTPEVLFTVRAGTQVRVRVEVARNDAERARGLMHRRSLEPGTGMLFLFPAPDYLKFWMRNTYIPLDMIFLDRDKKVVYVEENAEPLTDTPRGPDEPAQFVLEVPGGWARPHGIEPGVTATFVGVL
jgi:uncharacterized membrane protein (UPF0127 family)